MSPPLHATWSLTSDPFPFAGRSLSPRDDPGELNYYLNLYNWAEGENFKGLAADGTVEIEPLPGYETTTILISGESGSGRSSVKNLLVYQLAKDKDPAPVLLDIPVPPSANRHQVALLLSMKVLLAVQQRNPAAADQVQQTIQTWQAIAGADPSAETLFVLLGQNLASAIPDAEVIVTLDASSHNLTRDAARQTNAMLRGFATYVIMSLTAADDARFIKHSPEPGRRAWIDATSVEPAKIKCYVARSLKAQRAKGFAPPTDIFPFTSEAIDELFAATSGGGHHPLTISIALTRLASALQRKTAAPGKPPVTITKADMRAYLA